MSESYIPNRYLLSRTQEVQNPVWLTLLCGTCFTTQEQHNLPHSRFAQQMYLFLSWPSRRTPLSTLCW